MFNLSLYLININQYIYIIIVNMMFYSVYTYFCSVNVCEHCEVKKDYMFDSKLCFLNSSRESLGRKLKASRKGYLRLTCYVRVWLYAGSFASLIRYFLWYGWLFSSHTRSTWSTACTKCRKISFAFWFI